MTDKQLEELKLSLLQMKQDILNGGYLTNNEDLQVKSEDLPDEGDLATSVINQEISFSMRARELNKLRAIDAALERIENGTYGACEECDEEIGFKRLKSQPFSSLCVTHAEEQEREQRRFLKHG